MAGHVQRWFDRLPEHWQERAQRLRELILEAAPGMEEKWMFKSSQFYLHHGWLCYFSFKKDQLIIGFIQGKHMADPQGLFALTDHKQIRHYLPPEPATHLDERAFQRLIEEAVEVNVVVAVEKATRRRTRAGGPSDPLRAPASS